MLRRKRPIFGEDNDKLAPLKCGAENLYQGFPLILKVRFNFFNLAWFRDHLITLNYNLT